MIWTQPRACLKISPPRWYSRKELHTTWSLLLSCQAKRNTLSHNFLPEFLYDGHSVNCHFDINLTKSIQKCFFISALSIYYDRLIWRRQMDRKWLFAQPAPKCTLQLHAWKKGPRSNSAPQAAKLNLQAGGENVQKITELGHFLMFDFTWLLLKSCFCWSA